METSEAFQFLSVFFLIMILKEANQSIYLNMSS